MFCVHKKNEPHYDKKNSRFVVPCVLDGRKTQPLNRRRCVMRLFESWLLNKKIISQKNLKSRNKYLIVNLIP